MEYIHSSFTPITDPTVVIGGGGGAASMTAAYTESVRTTRDISTTTPPTWTVVVGTFDRGGSSGVLSKRLGLDHGVGDGGNNIKAGIINPDIQTLFNNRFDEQNPNDTPESRAEDLYRALHDAEQSDEQSFCINDFKKLSRAAQFASDLIGRELHGHSFRNLAIAGLMKQRDYSVNEAFKITSRGVGSLVNVVAVSDYPMELIMRDGCHTIYGEEAIDTHHIQDPNDVEISLVPEGRISSEAQDAIEASNLLIIAPGSPFTSILPLLSLSEVREALHTQMNKGGQRIGILNIVNNPHDTAGWTASTYYQEYKKYLKEVVLDALVVHQGKAPENLLEDTVSADSLIASKEVPVIAANVAGNIPVQDKLDSITRGRQHDPRRIMDAIQMAITV